MVSVITGLIQNTIICVNLAGSGGVIRWWFYCEPDVDILFTFFYLIEKGNTGRGEGDNWWVHIPHVSFCKLVT